MSIALASSFSVVGNFFRRSHCFPVLTPLSESESFHTFKHLGTAAFFALFNSYSSCVREVAYLELGVVEELFKYFFSNSQTAAEEVKVCFLEVRLFNSSM